MSARLMNGFAALFATFAGLIAVVGLLYWIASGRTSRCVRSRFAANSST